MEEENSLDSLIRQGRNFAIYRIPGEEQPRFVMQDSGPARFLYRIEDLNEQSGFIIAPFRVQAERPIVLIRCDRTELPADPIFENEYPGPDEPEEGDDSLSDRQLKRLYTKRFNEFTEPLLQGTLDKLVLSRHQTLRLPAGFSPEQAFYQACRRYTRSYVYLCHTPQTGTWLGSTPEILLSGQGGAWQTVALAGTQPLREGALPLSWDDKNRREQQIVAAYIRKQLRSLAIPFEESEPYAAHAGALSHLKSDFRFALPERNKLGDLLGLLHPTPAVCGLPKEEAYRFILRNEGYDRSYYSGFIGWLDPEGQSDLYVNLRCMHIRPRHCTLYAGGGLLSSSSLEEEWQETQDKLQTMKWLLNMHAQLI